MDLTQWPGLVCSLLRLPAPVDRLLAPAGPGRRKILCYRSRSMQKSLCRQTRLGDLTPRLWPAVAKYAATGTSARRVAVTRPGALLAPVPRPGECSGCADCYQWQGTFAGAGRRPPQSDWRLVPAAAISPSYRINLQVLRRRRRARHCMSARAVDQSPVDLAG